MNDTGLLLTGVGYKVMKEGKVTEQNQNTINEMTDVVIDCAQAILNDIKKVDARDSERGQRMEALKRDTAVCKRKLAETTLERDQYRDRCATLEEEKDRLEQECKRLKTELGKAEKSLTAMSFEEDLSLSPPEETENTGDIK